MNDAVLKVFIGYDPAETVAWHVMAHSVLSQSSRPVALVPVNLANLGGIYTRDRHPHQSNEFSISRFLVPWLCGYSGYGVFFDCDMLLRGDLAEMLKILDTDPNKAVYVVQHDYQPRDQVKFLGQRQYVYPRKNWSSVVLWNCSHSANRILTTDYVNTANPVDLHRFNWLGDKDIGILDVRWNWLVGEYDLPPSDVKNVHWTVGGPYFEEYRNADFSEEWRVMQARVNYCQQREEL